MKKALLLAAASVVAMGAFAQNKIAQPIELTTRLANKISNNVANKAAGNGDTIIRTNIILSGTGADTLTRYVYSSPARDTGYITGYNYYNDKAYAELYRINNAGTPDSSISVIGMYTYLTGRATANSTKQVVLTAWSSGPRTNPIPGRNTIFFSGRPDAVIGSQSVMLKDLRSNTTTGQINTDTIIFFQTPSTYTFKDFFAGIQLPGYTWSSLAGDTAVLVSTKDGNRRASSVVSISGTDTTFLLQNLVQDAAGNWEDFYQEHPTEMFFHLFALPVIKISITSSVNGVSQKDLTVFGTFPNPATSATTLKLGFANNTSAQIDLYDMTGRKVREVYNGKLAAGNHDLPINTADLNAGNYVIMVRTANGEGMGLQMTVAK